MKTYYVCLLPERGSPKHFKVHAVSPRGVAVKVGRHLGLSNKLRRYWGEGERSSCAVDGTNDVFSVGPWQLQHEATAYKEL